MVYPEIELAQSIIEICKAKNIKNIVISPGSRNAPLTIGFASNPFFNCYSIADERCAGFFALGIAQQTKYPTVVICTSGSALLNYYPALSEAFYSQIPFIVISADRPTSKIDIGDGQTIRQRNVYQNHTLFNANLSEKASIDNDRLISEAIDQSIIGKGPVHINAPFEEPLYNTVSELSVNPTIFELKEPISPKINTPHYAEEWKKAPKKLVIVGINSPNEISQKTIDFLANDPTVVVMTETTSNINNSNFVHNIDTLITPFNEEDFKEFQPDILITCGGMLTSKRIKSFLRKYRPKSHWHIDLLRFYDTFGCLSDKIQDTAEHFFGDLQAELKDYKAIGEYQSWVTAILEIRTIKQKEYLKNIPFSDLKAFEIIVSKLPKNIHLQISNSSPIRYTQLFKIDPSIEVFCNRGTSGIDGSTSTSIGATVANEKPTVFIAGDIGFLYDSNALWNAYIPNNYKLILVNNSGGGIFRILPGHTENKVFNTFFETSHNLNASNLASMYNLDYYCAENAESLENELNTFFNKNDKAAILEIKTPTLLNNQVLTNYFKNLI